MSKSVYALTENSKYELQHVYRETFKGLYEMPIFMCIGSSRVSGDTLGPLVGDFLRDKYNIDTFVYGCMADPITARNVESTYKFISAMHFGAKVVAIDAGVGKVDTLGFVSVKNDGLYPGLAMGKVLEKVGDYSIIGVVSENSAAVGELLMSTKRQIVHEMADIIAGSLYDFFTYNLPVMSAFKQGGKWAQILNDEIM